MSRNRTGEPDTTVPEAEVRDAGETDAKAIHNLACELAAEIGDETPRPEDVKANLSELMHGANSGVLVAEADSGVVGVVSYWIKPDLAHGDQVLEIPMLVVSEEYRRDGVGRALVAAVTDRAAEAGASLVELVVVPTNVRAREFYRSMGFVETDHLILEFVGSVDDFSEIAEAGEQEPPDEPTGK